MYPLLQTVKVRGLVDMTLTNLTLHEVNHRQLRSATLSSRSTSLVSQPLWCDTVIAESWMTTPYWEVPEITTISYQPETSADLFGRLSSSIGKFFKFESTILFVNFQVQVQHLLMPHVLTTSQLRFRMHSLYGLWQTLIRDRNLQVCINNFKFLNPVSPMP